MRLKLGEGGHGEELADGNERCKKGKREGRV